MILNRATKEIHGLDIDFSTFYHQLIYYFTFIAMGVGIIAYTFPYLLILIALFVLIFYRVIVNGRAAITEVRRLLVLGFGGIISVLNEYLDNNLLISSL
jgi:hypothetical protein